MGKRKKTIGKGNICPHCNVEMEYENGENGENLFYDEFTEQYDINVLNKCGDFDIRVE